MKKNTLYIFCLLLFIAAIGGIVYKYNKKEKDKESKIYGLLERKGSSSQTEEWKTVKAKAGDLQAALQKNPSDVKSAEKLASLYIQEARETGNCMYYDMAAMKLVNRILKDDPYNFNALVFKSLIYLSQHHFAEGLETARAAQQVNPYNAYVYGLLVDGNVEMGNYDSAVIYADKMVSIRPDLTSYSRVSYLREIFGDYAGAIKAMKMAVEAGGRGDEHTEWTRVQLGSLHEKTGDFKSADSVYAMALSVRLDYPYAMAGVARVAMAANDYNKAIVYFEKAASLIADVSIKEELVEAYRLAGLNKKADDLANKVIGELSRDSKSADDDAGIGHYADRELAYAYLKVKDTDKALEHALLEYNRRPENIDVNETLAWVYYNKGDYAKALPYMKVAMKTHSKNPVLLSRAGLIYFKAGDIQTAKFLLQQVPSSNLFVDHLLRMETLAVLQNFAVQTGNPLPE